MKLQEALLCLDCDEVFQRGEKSCPKCGSGAWFPLGNWMIRHVQSEIILKPLQQSVERRFGSHAKEE